MSEILYPTLVMSASKMHNGHISRWRIYKEQLGVPYSYYITGSGWRVDGSAGSLAEARAKIANYYAHTTIQES